MGNLKHRADIDGLRAVAILPVVMFHAFPALVGGGFIGVDVFFVISGYLISSIVFVELAQRRFSYRIFYARRVRRLAPALILVLATTLAAGWLELFPHEFASLGENVAGGAAFVSNFVLYGQSGYFDAASEAKPLLHLWSLGIEEQFYIVWPFLLTLLPSRKAFLGCVVLLLVSFALNVYVTRTNAAEAFYFPFTRWWELMAGAALGWIVVFQPFSSRYRDVISATGLLLIIGAAVGLHKGVQFPGWWALVPVLGAVALIASDGAWINRKILSSVPMVSIGLISYPLYLWHWPLLAFARVSSEPDNPSPLLIAALVLLSFVFAAMTYLWVEKPIRFGQWRKSAVAPLCGSLAALAILGGAISYAKGFPSRISDGLQAIIAGQLIPKPYSYHDWRIETCFIEDSKSDWKFAPECYGNGKHPLTLLWGSSTAASLYPALVGPLKASGYDLAQFTAVDCGPTLDSVVAEDNQHCVDVNKFVVDDVVPNLKPDVIIMHTAWRTEETIKYIGETVEALLKKRAPQIIIVGPEPWWSARDGLPEVYVDYARQNPDRPLLPQRTQFELEPWNKRNDEATRKEAASAGVAYISMFDQLCNTNGCLTRVGNSLRTDMTTYDRVHLTPKAWGLLIPSIMAKLKPGL